MTSRLAPSEVPVCDDADHEELYARAEDEASPFLAADERATGYAVTYDLAPAGRQLTEAARSELETRVRDEVESIVTDAGHAVDELEFGVGNQLGTVHHFEAERTAREVAATVSATVLDESNWEGPAEPSR